VIEASKLHRQEKVSDATSSFGDKLDATGLLALVAQFQYQES